MQKGTIKDPTLTVNGATLVFPAELTSGAWIECNGPEECILYGVKGEVLGLLNLSNPLPTFRTGRNEVQFSGAVTQGPAARVKVTFFADGPEL